jgi:hypothetical protein
MELYFAYSNENEKDASHVKKMLTPILKRFGWTAWGMEDIIPGYTWREDIEKHLKNSSLFVPLVSGQFLASDMCLAESERAIELSIQIVPILLDYCLFEYSIFADFDFLPNKKVPIKAWKRQNEAWAIVQRELVKIIQEKKNG